MDSMLGKGPKDLMECLSSPSAKVRECLVRGADGNVDEMTSSGQGPYLTIRHCHLERPRFSLHNMYFVQLALPGVIGDSSGPTSGSLSSW